MAEAENVIDNYEFINCIATGNATAIWEVKHTGNGQAYAMKLLLPESLKSAEAKASLKHEYGVGKAVSHPNIIQFYDYKLTKKFGYFTMEHVRSGNLKGMIRSEPAVAQGRCKKIMECLTQALAVMHEKNWIHRDLKPENVLVSKAGDVKLIDFSLASRPTGFLAKTLTLKSRVVIQGTRTYLAPELVQRQPLTFAADMYSLGILLYEILTGNPPFRTANPNELLMMHVRERVTPPSELNPNVTPELDAVVIRMLAKKPADRPKSMRELFGEIRSLKFFKEDPEAHAKVKAEKAEVAQKASVDVRLDSRADAERQRLIAEGVLSADDMPKPRQKAKPSAAMLREMQQKEEAKKKPAAATPPAPAQPMPGYPMQPGYGMQPMPGMPMMQYPGMPYPGMPQPGMMPPGMPFPGMQYPGMPQPGMSPQAMPQPGMPYPGMPPQGMPQAGMLPPQGPPRPAAPPAQAPRPAVPPAAAGPAPATPTAPKPTAPPPAKPPEDIPLASIDDIDLG